MRRLLFEATVSRLEDQNSELDHMYVSTCPDIPPVALQNLLLTSSVSADAFEAASDSKQPSVLVSKAKTSGNNFGKVFTPIRLE